jgi:hypothetical protein
MLGIIQGTFCKSYMAELSIFTEHQWIKTAQAVKEQNMWVSKVNLVMQIFC